jgi:prohead serine protease
MTERKYTSDDADVHTIHADTAKKKKVWADIANQALENGKSDDEAVDEANDYVAKMRSAEKTTLNSKGAAHARSLVSAGKVDKDSEWRFSAADGDKLLGADGDDWNNYAKWFLGEDASAKQKTKQRFKYPFGKNGKVYKSALDAIRSRAAAESATKIFETAGDLLDAIDDSKGDPDRSATRSGKHFPSQGAVESRFADLKPSSYDAKARTVTAVLSIGAAVKRFYGTEVLEITPKAVNLDRVASCGVPLIDSHNIFGALNGVLGRLERAWFEAGELLGSISFDDSEVGRQAEGLAARGMVRGISIGYRVDEWEIKDADGNIVDPERERLIWDELYTFTAKRWELLEVSMVSVPADPSAFIRSGNADKFGDDALARRANRVIYRNGSLSVIYELPPANGAPAVLSRMRARQAMLARRLVLDRSLRDLG